MQFHRAQLCLLPLMLVIPVLAMLGLFGGPRQREEIDLHGVTLTVEFAPLDHLEDWGRIHVTVANRSHTPLRDPQAEFSRAMIDQLWQPSFQPPLRQIDGEWYVVPLGGEVRPGESRAVTLDYRSTSPGRLRGVVRVRAGDEELAQVPLTVTVLP